MEKNVYEGELEIIHKKPIFDKKDSYIISHKNTDFIVRTNIKIKLKEGEKFLSFLGLIPPEYNGEKVIVTTFHEENESQIVYKHKLEHDYFYDLNGELIAQIEEKPIPWGPYLAFPADTHFCGMKK